MSEKVFPHGALDRLGELVLSGSVVFFVGAGLSLDSEKNSAYRLIARLVARFLALCWFLSDSGAVRLRQDAKRDPSELASLARDLTRRFKATFELQGSETRLGELATEANVSLLAREYYKINDWMTSAFGELAEALLELEAELLPAGTQHLEADLLARIGDDPELIGPLDLPAVGRLPPRYRGKALFLETLGFGHPGAMGGTPSDSRLDRVAESYRGLMRARYRVLGRLAREGLCPILVTTNYDLLLEGGYRLAGLDLLRDPPNGTGPARRGSNEVDASSDSSGDLEHLPKMGFRRFAKIAAAEDFFEQGGAQQVAHIVKIHGCAERYRESKAMLRADHSLVAPRTNGHQADPDTGPWRRALDEIVFTYREIQNWRDDSWARDLLRTLIRARTVVFAGYSGMDPVIHDTFRTVYEEMAERRTIALGEQWADPTADPSKPAQAPEQPPPVGAAEGRQGDAGAQEDTEAGASAPAFYFGVHSKMEFHGSELLRAASSATGETRPPPRDHPNHLSFVLPDKHPDAFPLIDDLFLWLQHRTVRKVQCRSVETHLRPVLTRLLGHPPAAADLEQFRAHLAALEECESRAVHEFAVDPKGEKGPGPRRTLEWIVGWSDRFHPMLLREYSLANAHLHHHGPGFDLESLRRLPWECPASAHPDWTAWSTVVEVGVRRLFAVYRGRPEAWRESTGWAWLTAGTGLFPTLLFSPDDGAPSIHALTIQTRGHERVDPRRSVAAPFATHTVWRLPPTGVPWPTEPARPVSESESDGLIDEYVGAPTTAELWSWASWRAPSPVRAASALRPGIWTPSTGDTIE